MRRILVMLLVLTLAATLLACSGEKTEQKGATEPQVQTMDTWEGPTPEDEARDLLGQDVQELLTLLGAPQKIEYYPSPMGEDTDEPMEEGMYYYDGFVVITLKEGESEIVYSVENRD